MIELQEKKQGKNVKNSPCKGDKAVEKKSVFGRYSDAELVDKVKALARDPCNSKFSRNKIQPLWHQTIKIREAMALSYNEFPRRKRKLQQFVKEKLKTHTGSLLGLPKQQNLKKLNRGLVSHAPSASCMLNLIDSAESFDKKVLLESHSPNSFLTLEGSFLEMQISSESSFIGEFTQWTSPCKDRSPLFDSDESFNCSNPLSPENLTSQEAPSLNLEGTVHSSSAVDNSRKKHLKPLRRSSRIGNFIADCPQKAIVPVGACFQADVPDWTSPCNGGNYDSDLRWLGTRIWPPELGKTKTNDKDIGKGRPDSCSCVSPSSKDCIRRHILEKRLFLQCDLGSAFFRWKFDEMGEQVSKTWTLEQQKRFESLAIAKSPSKGKGFLKDALKCFPYKCHKSIMNYYFNVYIPRRISMMTTRLSSKDIDSDEDEVKEFNYLGFQKKFKDRASTIHRD